ncbi:metal ABC transporter solute-binding protein, Zn/Mn family [Enterovirga rhinocerotis]|uniref:Zinc/manganese transport system substrate-binding protein n=1 Tax=Enterovirga rhinocerotis TaxID=1339210 RepID=A0A4V3DYN1_9HYPH|nr:zinc ABC transporter substrate-binding protein [Enterovirga rhinocerotis]TDR93289.1 zinc/manganese transport system substrate-binding protein [Enterovirga rhinocerotis]
MTITRRILLASGLLAATGVRAQQPAADAPLPVVASFSILADFIREIGGDRVSVSSLVGRDADAHGFEPSPADAARLAQARLVVVNGLGFEGWMDRLVKASGSKAPVVVASRGVKPIAAPGGGHAHGHGHGHGHSHGHAHDHDADPHAFQSVANAKLYVAAIRDALVAADGAGKAVFEAQATRYLGELDRLDAEIKAEIARIPQARRRVITDHDAFAYFGAAYGIRFVAPRGVSRSGDVSAKDVARIVRQVKADKIPALFFENVADPRLIEQIARESGAKIGGKLYSDALSAEGGPAPTYPALMRHNAKTLAGALAE